jgi:hypothetical protein
MKKVRISFESPQDLEAKKKIEITKKSTTLILYCSSYTHNFLMQTQKCIFWEKQA